MAERRPLKLIGPDANGVYKPAEFNNDDYVPSTSINDGSITGSKLASDTITRTNMGDASVGTEQIVNNTITHRQLRTDQVGIENLVVESGNDETTGYLLAIGGTESISNPGPGGGTTTAISFRTIDPASIGGGGTTGGRTEAEVASQIRAAAGSSNGLVATGTGTEAELNVSNAFKKMILFLGTPHATDRGNVTIGGVVTTYQRYDTPPLGQFYWIPGVEFSERTFGFAAGSGMWTTGDPSDPNNVTILNSFNLIGGV